MARSCGIRIGPRRYEIVVLDGTAKKHRIKAFRSAEFDTSAEDFGREVQDSIREAIRDLNVPKENVGLVIDSGHAAFRHLSLPLDDLSKVDQVIKFEVESKLPQWNIEDVVVDYHVAEQAASESELLVTAVPKDDIRSAVDLVASAGVEPIEVELETSAMVNAAHTAELFSIESAQLLVHVGDYSTSVVLVDGGSVREMRVIHIGALNHEAPGPSSRSEDDDEASESEEVTIPEPDPVEMARRVEQATKRIRRELGRTISAARTRHPIDSIYVCGMELPDLIGSSVLDVPVYVLDCFEEDGGQPVDGFGELVVAYGAACRQLGGGCMTPSLRREDLRYAGTWERIEFPLAVASLLLVTMLGVLFILQTRKLGFNDQNGFGLALRYSNAWMAGDGRSPGRLYPVPEELEMLVREYPPNQDQALYPEGVAEDYANRTLKTLTSKVDELKRDLGQDANIKQPQSAFVGTQLVLDVLASNAEKWRPSIRRIQGTTIPKKGEVDEFVQVNLRIVFFADSQAQAVGHYEEFIQELEGKPWLTSLPDVGNTPLADGRGIEITSLRIGVNSNWFYDDLRRKVEEQVQ